MPRFSFALIVLLSASTAAIASSGSSGPTVGSIAPDFKARNLLTGEKIPLSGQRGKVVILTFWASWCAPCRRELPILEKAQEVVGKDKLTVFAVSYRENPNAARAIRQMASSLQINLVEDSNGWIAGRYTISSIPHLFIIGRDGTVLANHIGYGDRTLNELVDDINHALTGAAPAEPEPPPTTPGST
jgi:thiol-disulfide isomerase/thioredoxin